MASAQVMPLQQVLQALQETPAAENQTRAVLAYISARWQLGNSDGPNAVRTMGLALEAMPNLRPAMRVLYRIYSKAQDIRSAVMYLDQEIRATRHPREAAALYRERGQLVELNFNDLSAALQCHQAALKATPQDMAVLRSVERVQLARGDVFGLIAVLESQLEAVKDADTAAAVLHDLARLEARLGGDLALAADMLAHALELKPGHTGLVSDLFRLSEVGDDPEMMLLALELEAERLEGPLRAMPLARACLVLRELRERGPALELLRAATQAQPDNLSLWRNLEELAMVTSRYDIAVEACIGSLKATDEADEDTRAGLFYRLGRMAMIRLDQVNEGLAAMRRCLRIFPNHIVAMEDTARYLISNQMWAQLLELLKLQITNEGKAGLTRNEKALARLRAGQVLEERLGELDGARKLYEEATLIAPMYRPVRDRLERVLHQLDDRAALIEHYRKDFDLARSDTRRHFLLSVLGQLAESLERPDEAIKYLGKLLLEQPKHLPALQRMARLLARQGRTKDVLRITDQEIRLTDSPGRKAKLLHRAGELSLELSDRPAARAYFSQAVDVVDDDAASIRALDELLRESDDREALLELLRTQILYTNDRERRAHLQLEAANLLAYGLDRHEDALKELDQLLQRAPKNLSALHAAEQLARKLENWPTLAELLERHAAAVDGPRTRALLLHRCASVRMNKLEDPTGAIRNLTRALELWPQLGVARALLLRLYENQGLARELQTFAEAGLTEERGSDDRRAMALQLAELSPRPVVEVQYLSAVAEVRPEDFVTQLRLGRAAHRAHRQSRAAGAFARAADAFAAAGAGSHPEVEALRLRAARAEELAGNLDRADNAYAIVLDANPGHAFARAGRLRVKHRKTEMTKAAESSELINAQADSDSDTERATYATIRAELSERRDELDTALRLADDALISQPDFLPALHARARILERLGGRDSAVAAMLTLEQVVDVLTIPAHKERALVRIGRIALRIGEPGESNPTAWSAFARAMELEPNSEQAFRGLLRTLNVHGTKGCPSLESTLMRRIESAELEDQLDRRLVRAAGRLAHCDGAQAAVRVLRRGVKSLPDEAGIRADLAQALAKLELWDEVVGALEGALAHELSPERSAALHFFAGDAHARAESLHPAVDHFLAAARAGFHQQYALAQADRIAAQAGDVDRRVEALSLLIELSPPARRIASLRTLAELYRGPIQRPEDAVDLLREVTRLRPTQLDPIEELHGLLVELGRHEEAKASVLAAIAHHRAWLRTHGIAGLAGSKEADVLPVIQLRRLFTMIGDADGVYLCTAVLETVAPEKLRGKTSANMLDDPFPLPSSQDARALDLLTGDLPASSPLALLQAGARVVDEMPGGDSIPPADPAHALPQNSAVVTVVQALAAALGVSMPLVFLDSDPVRQHRAFAYQGGTPRLVVGRRINASPSTTRARDLLGRALMRLANGGEQFNKKLSPSQKAGFLLGLCRAAKVETAKLEEGPLANAELDIAEQLSDLRVDDDLARAAQRYARSTEGNTIVELHRALLLAQDRAAVICAADPRPVLANLAEEGELLRARGTALLGYLVSDDHLALRRSLAYDTGIIIDLEEL